jgi:hypothetical protein
MSLMCKMFDGRPHIVKRDFRKRRHTDVGVVVRYNLHTMKNVLFLHIMLI